MRVIVRRERPTPRRPTVAVRRGRRLALHRVRTNTTTGQLQWLEARHRAHARVEDRIRYAKDTGLRRLPSREFAINQAWCVAAAIAADLITWLQLLALHGDLATTEPKGCATACSTPPPGSPTDSATAGCVSRHLALGRPHHRRVHPHRGDPRTRLTHTAHHPTTGGPQETTPPPRQTAHNHTRPPTTSINSDI